MTHANCDEGTDTRLPPPDSVRARYSRLSTGLRLFCSLSRSRFANAELLLFRIYLTLRDCFHNDFRFHSVYPVAQRIPPLHTVALTAPGILLLFLATSSPFSVLSIILFILSPVPQSTVSPSTNSLGCSPTDPGPIWCRCPSIPFWSLF